MHCLENSFGLVRQNSRCDDSFTRAIGIISRATVIVGVLRDLGFHPYIRRRDNVGGTILGKGSIMFQNTNEEKRRKESELALF
jgi:hypothetical protein